MKIIKSFDHLALGQYVVITNRNRNNRYVLAYGHITRKTKTRVTVTCVATAVPGTTRLVEFRDRKWRGIEPHNERDTFAYVDLQELEASDTIETIAADLNARLEKETAECQAKLDAEAKAATEKAEALKRKIAAFWEYAGRELWEEKRQVVNTVAGEMLVFTTTTPSRGEPITFFVKVWQSKDAYDWDYRKENREQRLQWEAAYSSMQLYFNGSDYKPDISAHSSIRAATIPELVFSLIHG